LLVDTHCHLNFESFNTDRPAVLERARQVGVRRILNPGIDLPTSRSALALAEATPEVYAAVGIHPNDADAWEAGTLAELKRLAGHPKVVAIGEIGLDDYWEKTPRALQEQVLQAQLELAAELGLPVVIHTRNGRAAGDHRATQDALAILGEWQRGLASAGNPQANALAQRPGVLHSFSDSLEFARAAVLANFYIGVTGPVTFKKADELRRVAGGAPLERLLIETDAPFLTPHPHRGERNEPAYVRFVAERIAELRDQPVEQFAQIITENAERLFLWQAIP
jgi:TatD DNase family protein